LRLGKEAAAKAINDAKSVAERNREGAIGEANALKDQRVQVSQTQQPLKVKIRQKLLLRTLMLQDAKGKQKQNA
jgi:hypothetical protein